LQTSADVSYSKGKLAPTAAELELSNGQVNTGSATAFGGAAVGSFNNIVNSYAGTAFTATGTNIDGTTTTITNGKVSALKIFLAGTSGAYVTYDGSTYTFSPS
jgi:hypothetical protein